MGNKQPTLDITIDDIKYKGNIFIAGTKDIKGIVTV